VRSTSARAYQPDLRTSIGIVAQSPTLRRADYVRFPLHSLPLREQEAGHFACFRELPGDETELTDPEDVVHDFRSGGDHGTQFPAVHGLGRGCGAVTD
jgi:hypothetical protein